METNQKSMNFDNVANQYLRYIVKVLLNMKILKSYQKRYLLTFDDIRSLALIFMMQALSKYQSMEIQRNLKGYLSRYAIYAMHQYILTTNLIDKPVNYCGQKRRSVSKELQRSIEFDTPASYAHYAQHKSNLSDFMEQLPKKLERKIFKLMLEGAQPREIAKKLRIKVERVYRFKADYKDLLRNILNADC